jgi:hypothetical protein
MFAGLILRLPEIDRQESERKQKALDKIRCLLESKQLKMYMKELEKSRMRKS